MRKFRSAIDLVLALLFFALFVILMPTACGYYEARGNPSVPPNSSNFETFLEIDTKIIQPHCAACHDTFEPLNYAAVMQYVVAGDAAASTFWQVLDSGRMPKRRAKLSQDLIDGVAAWIAAGAVEK